MSTILNMSYYEEYNSMGGEKLEKYKEYERNLHNLNPSELSRKQLDLLEDVLCLHRLGGNQLISIEQELYMG
jgi:hypothetical protein